MRPALSRFDELPDKLEGPDSPVAVQNPLRSVACAPEIGPFPPVSRPRTADARIQFNDGLGDAEPTFHETFFRELFFGTREKV